MKRQSPKGFGTAFAKAKGAGKDTFEFEGKTYRTQGGYNYAKPIGDAKTKKPAKVKAGASNPPTQKNTKSLRPKTRPTGSVSRRNETRAEELSASQMNEKPKASTRKQDTGTPTGSGVNRTAGSQADSRPRGQVSRMDVPSTSGSKPKVDTSVAARREKQNSQYPKLPSDAKLTRSQQRQLDTSGTVYYKGQRYRK